MPTLCPRRSAPLFRGVAALLAACLLTASAPTASAQPGGPFGAPAGPPETVAIVALSGWQPLLDDVDYLGALAGMPQQGQSVENMIKLFTANEGLKGLDKTRPWGVVVQMAGMMPTGVVCLPVDDLEALLKVAAPLGLAAEDAGGGVTQLSVPQSPQPLFAKQVGDWTFVSNAAETLDAPPADPTELMSDLLTSYDIGVRAYLQKIPAMLREMAIGEIRKGAEEGLVQGPDETAEQFAAREELARIQLESLVKTIEETDEVTVGVSIGDSEPKGVALDFMMTAIAGSETASQFATVMDVKTDFAGFQNDAATFTGRLSAPIEASEAAQMKSLAKVLRTSALEALAKDESIPNEETRGVLESAIDEMVTVLEETIDGGKLDVAMTLDITPDRLSLLAGAAAKSPEKMESALRKLSKISADEPGAPTVEWNAHSHAGVNFHSISMPLPPNAPPAAADMFGDTVEMAVGIGGDKLYLAVGSDWMTELTAAMDDSASSADEPAKPMMFSISMASVAELAKSAPGPNAMMAQMLAAPFADAMGDDHITFYAEGVDGGVRYRLVLEESVLKAVAPLIQIMMMQGMGGGPGPGF